MKRLFLLSVLLVGAATTAQATTVTYQFKDVARPHGHVRGVALRHAAGRACGASASLTMPKNISAFETCMAAKGWRFAGTIVSRSPVVARRAPAFDPGQTASDDRAAQDAAATQATEEANDDAARESASQTQQAEQTQDMINTQNEVNNQNAIAAQEAATVAASTAFDQSMTAGNQ